MEQEVLAIVMAAGKGTRMKSKNLWKRDYKKSG